MCWESYHQPHRLYERFKPSFISTVNQLHQIKRCWAFTLINLLHTVLLMMLLTRLPVPVAGHGTTVVVDYHQQRSVQHRAGCYRLRILVSFTFWCLFISPFTASFSTHTSGCCTFCYCGYRVKFSIVCVLQKPVLLLPPFRDTLLSRNVMKRAGPGSVFIFSQTRISGSWLTVYFLQVSNNIKQPTELCIIKCAFTLATLNKLLLGRFRFVLSWFMFVLFKHCVDLYFLLYITSRSLFISVTSVCV